MYLSLTIPGAPVAKGRPRITTAGGFQRTFTPKKTRDYENLIKSRAFDAMAGRPPIAEAVALEITAFVAIPASLSKVKRAAALSGDLKPVTRPDIDNYVKAALDGLNGVVFRDDNQVTDLRVRKRYSDAPRLEIVVSDGLPWRAAAAGELFEAGRAVA